MKTLRQLVNLVLLAALGSALPACAGIVYSQPWDGNGGIIYSQNDPNLFGPYATSYDNFTVASGDVVKAVSWVGGYYNPAVYAPIIAFSIQFYNDNSDQPGTSIFSETITGGAHAKRAWPSQRRSGIRILPQSEFTVCRRREYAVLDLNRGNGWLSSAVGLVRHRDRRRTFLSGPVWCPLPTAGKPGLHPI